MSETGFRDFAASAAAEAELKKPDIESKENSAKDAPRSFKKLFVDTFIHSEDHSEGYSQAAFDLKFMTTLLRLAKPDELAVATELIEQMNQYKTTDAWKKILKENEESATQEEDADHMHYVDHDDLARRNSDSLLKVAVKFGSELKKESWIKDGATKPIPFRPVLESTDEQPLDNWNNVANKFSLEDEKEVLRRVSVADALNDLLSQDYSRRKYDHTPGFGTTRLEDLKDIEEKKNPIDLKKIVEQFQEDLSE